ncbi:hypothetical protein KR038_007091 [Drosophila bunnanda]|nr:hypothetical protein KR038_007091 [Drosophila bunnanda]
MFKMRLFFSFLWLSSVSLLTASPDISEPQDRIIGGHETEIDEAPWQVSLQANGMHTCGGSIYSTTIIITAAHCVHGVKTGTLSIRAGSSKHNSGGILIEVAALKYHEKFDKVTGDNDVAVILLKEALPLNLYIQSIPLAETDPAEGSRALSTGWGLRSGLILSTHLLGVTLPIIDYESCLKTAPPGITNVMICAAAPGKDSCSGDSGGPLVSGGELVGIVSFGWGCSHPKYPGVYADVAKLRPWLLQAINRI